MYVDIPNLLNLSTVPGIGATKLRSLVAKFKSTKKVFEASVEELKAIDGIDLKGAREIKNFSNFEYGEIQYERAKKLNAEIVTFWDDKYPIVLKKIHDPPVFLFLKGKFDEYDRYSLAIVGTRSPSSYGKIIAEKIARDLSNKGLTVVSGLARGVDTIAHSTAISTGGRTIAVTGSGLDVIYPSENRKLTEQIWESGAVITEQPMGAKPDAVNFPKRNRIIAGLTLGTIVIEAGEKSGALITANLALEYNREVFAIPGNITNNKSWGCNQLIKEGAKLVQSIDDILDELKTQLRRFSAQAKQSQNFDDLQANEMYILKNLTTQPIHIDELARKLNQSTGQLLSILLTLEFKDFVRQLPGKLFVRTF
ncbi:DNA-protecting protein DprA [candidate division KSB1 bacterium]|nr:DNA-protecting protein DprA [candidate division KSB1 bacterium]